MVLHILSAMSLDTDTLFRMLANPTRLRILMLLQREGVLCVCELTHALSLSQPKISRHLAHLRESGLLLSSRNGQWVYYSISPALPGWIQAIMQATLEGNANAAPFCADRHMLQAMPNRPGAVCCA